MTDPTESPSFSRRDLIKTLVFSSAALGAGWPSASKAADPKTDFGKKGVHFLAVGDFGSGKEGQTQVARKMNEFAAGLGEPLTAVLALGDNIYNMLTPERL